MNPSIVMAGILPALSQLFLFGCFWSVHLCFHCVMLCTVVMPLLALLMALYCVGQEAFTLRPCHSASHEFRIFGC